MPASRFLLDTNIVIALLEGEAAVLASLDHASEVFLSAIVVGELFFWRRKVRAACREHSQVGGIRGRQIDSSVRSRCGPRIWTPKATSS